ncbi:hypothetical protein Leryth_023944 [Lithospermum erythrorhizon]|nr:hypothetical protein Leryth_023944 [Lithospermum erythrorhizon]
MATQKIIIFLFFLPFLYEATINSTNQSEFFSLMNKYLLGDAMNTWDLNGGKNYCNFIGVECDNKGNVFKIDISGWSLSGPFPEQICAYLPELKILRVGHNDFHGNFPMNITRECFKLQELNMSSSHFFGALPDFSGLKSLRILDLSSNKFTGNFPFSVTNISSLEILNFNENDGFDEWELPDSFTKLTKLRTLYLMTCMLNGSIPAWLGNMTSLVDLELTGNYLVGKLPPELGKLKNLRQLELYYNQLEGEIPEELGNLKNLVDLDMSVNKFIGKIPESICRLPNLRVLQLYNNSLTGEIPPVIANSTTLKLLSLYSNFLTGEIPQDLGRFGPLEGLDLSENQLTGKLPAGLCDGGKLKYLLVLSNKFHGELPESYAKCQALIRFRVSSNMLEGKIPEGLFALRHVSIIDVGYNRFTGSIPKSIGNAKNLSELFMQNNKISGELPVEISKAINLVKVDLSNNLLSGPIPKEIGKLKKLNVLALEYNNFTSSIPDSLSSLRLINVLDLSSNQFTGNIPVSLGELLPNSMNFSNNLLSGPIPVEFLKAGLTEGFSGNKGLCLPTSPNSSHKTFPPCSPTINKKKTNLIWVIVMSIGIVFLGSILFLKRWFNREKAVVEHDDTLSSSFFSYDVKSFHRITFDQKEIFGAMVDKNVVGCGGSGTVYRMELRNGEEVAVKKLWSRKSKDPASSDDQLNMDKELKTEVETLGSIRHKNIVKLYCYFSGEEFSLLVYEFMPNGNLWDVLHRGKLVLDWTTRYQIALGVAQGLAYLHHDLTPPIIHRDIKSTNILLDVDYQPKVADFGIAKVLQARTGKDSTTTVVAGTYGYLAPEYAYSSKATTMCDVYSFGVVLMELLTGKKPVEPEFGENKNIISWVSTKIGSKEGAMEVLDKRVSESFKEEMIKVLKIAIRCTLGTPTLRPTMSEVVQLLIEADQCRFESYKSFNKTKNASNNVTNPK